MGFRFLARIDVVAGVIPLQDILYFDVFQTVLSKNIVNKGDLVLSNRVTDL